MQKLIIATLIAFSGVGPSLYAQDSTRAISSTGKWDLKWVGRNGQDREATASFTQDGGKLSGTVEIEGHSVPLTGTVKGTTVSFVVQGRQSRSFSFSGTIQGDTIRGQTQLGSDWTGARQSRTP